MHVQTAALCDGLVTGTKCLQDKYYITCDQKPITPISTTVSSSGTRTNSIISSVPDEGVWTV